MRILVVDDRPEKIGRIKKVLIERCAVKDSDVDVAASVSSGVKAVKCSFYDLLILDLNLPQFDKEAATEDGGLSFLKMLKTEGTVNPPLQTICLTEYPEILDKNRGEYEDLMVSTIVKKDGDSLWIDQLAEIVIYSRRLRSHVTNVLCSINKFDVGVICAIQEEFEMLLDAFGREKWSDFPVEGVSYRIKQISVSTETVQSVRIVAACAGAPGGIAIAALSAFMYGTFSVDYLFMTGITGGINKGDNLKLGDIVVAKSVQEYAVGKLADNGDGDTSLLKENAVASADADTLNRMAEYISDEDVIARVNSKIAKAHLRVKEDEQYRATISPTVSGPFVMTAPSVVSDLLKVERKLKAIDMEGYAFYYTSYLYHKPALWVKGISDFADMEKDDTYHKVAAYASAALVSMFIKEKIY